MKPDSIVLFHAGDGGQAGDLRRRTAIDSGGSAHRFDAELAGTPERRRCGLAFRREFAPDAGMLFVFDAPGVQAMWMKDAPLSLDLLFFDAGGALLGAVDPEPAGHPLRAGAARRHGAPAAPASRRAAPRPGVPGRAAAAAETGALKLKKSAGRARARRMFRGRCRIRERPTPAPSSPAPRCRRSPTCRRRRNCR